MLTLISKHARVCVASGVFGCLFLTSSFAMAVSVQVSIQNLSPANGVFLTPAWVGFHDGSFDLYDRGAAIGASGLPSGLESLAEDGDTSSVSTSFAGSSAGSNGGIDRTVIGPSGVPGPIDPGETVTSQTFELQAGNNEYFSYASMVIPSNDAFIANGDPFAHDLFDGSGNFVGADFFVLGTQVLDAGTEVNDELPVNTAFLGQMTPNTGMTEFGTVEFHSGFVAGGNILKAFPGGDFTQSGYQVARISVSAVPEAVPEPSTVLLFGSGFIGLAAWRWRKGRQGLH